MNGMLIALVLPFAGSLVMPLLARGSDRWRGLVAAGIALTSFGLILQGSGPVLDGGVLEASWPWFPSLGVRLGFFVDGLSLLFGLLISGVGTLVAVYAVGYLHDDRVRDYFWFSLLLFMGSMLGLVFSSDMLLVAVFWELTRVASFLLIGLRYWKVDSRRGELNALFVAVIAGLALLAAVLLLGAHTGSYAYPDWIAHGLDGGPLVTSAMLLILVAAFTKSAHFPFHFWLPQAMAAPTPVSAYLHSATMVKAGVYLLARTFPLFADNPYWTGLILAFGLVTFLVGGVLAVAQEDVKKLLAYSTVSHLGMMTFMLGLNTASAVLGALLHLVAHATFKGALFMGGGAIDHTIGTRRLDQIGPLRRSMPWAACIMSVSALSMAGFIPFSGYVSKEALLGGLEAVGYLKHPVLTIGALAGATLTALYSFRLIHGLSFGAARVKFTAGPEVAPGGLDRLCLLVPPLILTAATLWIGPAVVLRGGWMDELLGAAGRGVGTFDYHFALWHGLSLPFQLTLLVLGTGLVLYVLLPATRGLWRGLASVPGPENLSQGFHANLIPAARRTLRGIIRGPLNKYVRITVGFLLLVVLGAWWTSSPGGPAGGLPGMAVTIDWIPFLLVILAALGILGFDRPVPAVIALGALGFLVSTVFLVYRAPDLILTQISVETVSIVIFLWVLKDINFDVEAPAATRGVDLVLSALAAGGLGLFLLRVLEVKDGLTEPARYYLERSLPETGGRNVVNVILVDFRALDTLGEITVLGIAAVGVLAMLRVVFESTSRTEEAG